MFLESSPGFHKSTTSNGRLCQFGIAILLTVLTVFSAGCANVSSSLANQSPVINSSNVKLSLTPSTATIVSGSTQQFSAGLTSTSNTAVTWSATAGTISSGGMYTAPSVKTPTNVTVTATSVADANGVAVSQITVMPLVSLGILNATLPSGSAGTPYSASLQATGGTSPYQWQITAGSLPQGFSLNKSTGAISGTTSQVGNFNFTTSVTDAKSAHASASLSLAVNAATTGGNFDGPAELPRVYVQSALADTPAPGSVISVPAGGDFQQALNSAKCGETIQLQAGAVYTGNFHLPAQTCDDAHWIIIRTSTPDSNLPAEGTRISPCYAGVASLPSRPAFHCTSTNNVMPKIQFGGIGSGPIIFENGASHYRFIGVEITRTPGSGMVYNLAVRDQGASANHIIFDRCWIHGTPQDETERGVMMSGTQYIAVVDSYLSDFHCVSQSGSCVDAQAIAGGAGDVASGPFKILDNFLEGAAENVLFGGGEATVTPADIEIRYNHFFKPLIWKAGQPGFVGGRDGHPFIVKNLFELKNAQRVLFEGNDLENTWGGFSQFGFGIALGPKNQAIGAQDVCPICQVTDITIRYTKISHVGGGLQLGNGVSANGGVPLAGGRYSIHDVTIDDIDANFYDGYGTFAQVSTGPGAPALQNVAINHVTAFEPGVMLNLGDYVRLNGRMQGLVFTNNIINAGTAPTKTTGGGTDNCAYLGIPTVVLPGCFQSYTFTHNAIVATPSNYPPGRYPSGNFFPGSASSVGFVNYANGNGGDYHLHSNSPYKNAGTDGKDLGADIDAIAAATAGVE